MNKKAVFGDMKRSPSELALEELFKHTREVEDGDDDHRQYQKKNPRFEQKFGGDHGFFGFESDGTKCFSDDHSANLSLPFVRKVC